MQFLDKIKYKVEKTELYDGGTFETFEYKSKKMPGKYNFNIGISIPLSWKIR